MKSENKNIAILFFGISLPVFIFSFLTIDSNIEELLKILIQTQITIFGVFGSILLASLSGFEQTKPIARIFKNRSEFKNLLFIVFFSVLFSILSYITITATSYHPRVQNIVDIVPSNLGKSFLTASAAGLGFLTIGKLGLLITNFLQLYSDPSKVAPQIKEDIDLSSISEQESLYQSESMFFTLHQYICDAASGQTPGYVEGIQALEGLTYRSFDKIEQLEIKWRELSISEENEREKIKDDQNNLVKSYEVIFQSWSTITKTCIQTSHTNRLISQLRRSNEFFRELANRRLPHSAKHPVRNFMSVATLKTVRNKSIRENKYEGINRTSSNYRTRFLVEHIFLSSQLSIIDSNNVKREEKLQNMIDILYRSLGDVIGTIERDSDEADYVGILVISLFASLCQYKKREETDTSDPKITEHIIEMEATTLTKTVSRDIDFLNPAESINREIWFPSFFVIYKKYDDILPEKTKERLVTSAIELGLILDIEQELISVLLVYSQVNTDDSPNTIQNSINKLLSHDPTFHLSPNGGKISIYEDDLPTAGVNYEYHEYKSWLIDKSEDIQSIKKQVETKNYDEYEGILQIIKEELDVSGESESLFRSILKENQHDSPRYLY